MVLTFNKTPKRIYSKNALTSDLHGKTRRAPSLIYLWTALTEQPHTHHIPPRPLLIAAGDRPSSRRNKELPGTFTLGSSSKGAKPDAGTDENSNHGGTQGAHYDTANICLTAS